MAWRRHLWKALKVVVAVTTVTAALFLIYGASKATLHSPPPTLLLLDKNGLYLGEVADSHSSPLGHWPLKEIPPRVVATALAAEDRRFWSHPGVSPRAVIRAIIQNYKAGRHVSGASTIAMQVARLQTPGARTYIRKGGEAVTALLLTLRYGRRAILAHYLRIAPFGNRIRGISYAAQRYFDKPACDLTWAEAALLMAIPQSPGRMNLYTSKGRRLAYQRGKRILNSLYKEGFIPKSEYEISEKHISSLFPFEKPKNPHCALHVLEHYRSILDSKRATISSPIVYTTIDLQSQQMVQKILARFVKKWEGVGVDNGAALVITRKGDVVASVGSTDYFDKKRAGAIDYTRVKRSPGSMLKPFVYALALEKSVIKPASILDDLRRARGGIRNADYKFLGPLLPRQALANSRNVPAANLLDKLGVHSLFDLTATIKLHDGHTPSSQFGTGLVIGTMPVTLTALVRAYRTLADEGLYSPLRWYKEQELPDGATVLSSDSTRHITLFLSDPLARLPTFKRMGYLEYPFATAIKTGTSSQCRDAWCLVWSRKYLAAVWLGRPDYRPMNAVSGYGAAGRLLKNIFLKLEDGGDELEDRNFPPPHGHIPVQVCAATGKKAHKDCPRSFVEWFDKNSPPLETCQAHSRMVIDGKERTVLALAPKYASWASSQGLATKTKTKKAPQKGIINHDFVIVAPEDGIRLLRCPETPKAGSTIALEAVVSPQPEQLLWYVNGEPFELVEYPFTARWPLELGRHYFQVGLPGSSQLSNPVTISVE